MIIEYCSDGMAVPDHKVESLISMLVSADSGYIKVSTENVIYGTRAMIARGRISHEQIAFRFNGEDLKPNKEGRLVSWPFGFADYVDTWLDQLLEGAP